jgi:hypothetical protein
MKKYTVNIPDDRDVALGIVAEKDGLTKGQLIQKQIDYYTGTVIADYVRTQEDLTPEERDTFNVKMVQEKAAIIAARG